MSKIQQLDALIAPIRDDLTSGAAEISLRAITVFQSMLEGSLTAPELTSRATLTAKALMDAQPAMAPLFHLSNKVLLSLKSESKPADMLKAVHETLSNFEKQLGESAAAIADQVFNLIPAGELIFAYSFSSTVVSSLLNARSKGKYFNAVCTESRPAQEGRKLATVLAEGGIEVTHTFDTALALVLSECSVAFMGCDVVGHPGVVNKVGSWLLAVACRELGIPLYALAGTEKFVSDERLFEFEKHERPAAEVWKGNPKGVKVLNRQFELVPFSLLAGLVTENGILQEKDIANFVSKSEVHEALKLSSSSYA